MLSQNWTVYCYPNYLIWMYWIFFYIFCNTTHFFCLFISRVIWNSSFLTKFGENLTTILCNFRISRKKRKWYRQYFPLQSGHSGNIFVATKAHDASFCIILHDGFILAACWFKWPVHILDDNIVLATVNISVVFFV